MRFTSAFSAAAAFVLGAAVMPALAQAAPVALVGATPAADAAARDVRSLALRFSAPLEAGKSGAEIVMTAMPGMAHHQPMKVTGFGTALADGGRTLALTLPRALPAGTYRVSWHAAASDGQHGEGSYSFTVR